MTSPLHQKLSGPPKRFARWPLLAGYPLALGVTGLAALARVALDPLWGRGLPFITFFPSVMLAAWLGGRGPGLAATALGALLADYFWMHPVGSLAITAPGDAAAIVVFIVIGGAISEVARASRRARARLARSEERRRSAEERLRIALDAGHMGTWQWTLATGEVEWSPGLEAIHGLVPGSFAGTFEAVQRETHPDDRERVAQAITEAIATRRDHHVEYRIVRADGAVRWVEGRGQLFLDAEGRPERMAGVCLDVTERRQAQDRFRLALEAAPAAMVLVDAEGRMVLVNALTESLLGYGRNELIGLPVDQLVPGAVRAHHAGHWQAFFRNPQRRPMGAGRDLHAQRKDGSEIAVEIGLNPLETPEGLFVVAAITDITERKRAEQSVRAAQREAEEANRAKDQFLAIVSHELRTPLSAMLGWAHLLSDEALPEPQRRRGVAVIQTSARRQAQLIEELLDISRVLSGKLQVARAAVDVTQAASAAMDLVRPQADAKHIRLSLHADTGLGTIPADSDRVQQILGNLLSNAVKFTGDEGVIAVGVRQIDGEIEVSITDSGQGIPAGFLPFVFEPFRQADGSATREHGGLGLGLSIVRHLVEAHSGSVSAHSDGEGRGATFVVRLPCTLPSAEPAPVAVPAPGGDGHAGPSLRGVSVLVVDDDAAGREVLAVALGLHGAMVFTAASAAQALELLSRERIHALLADVAMPGQDGYALIRQVRALSSPENASMPAAALTALARPEDRERALAAGFQLHLVKPVDPRLLVEAVARLAASDRILSS